MIIQQIRYRFVMMENTIEWFPVDLHWCYKENKNRAGGGHAADDSVI
jgi:hypothetical protein